MFNAARNVPRSCLYSIAGQIDGLGLISSRNHERAYPGDKLINGESNTKLSWWVKRAQLMSKWCFFYPVEVRGRTTAEPSSLMYSASGRFRPMSAYLIPSEVGLEHVMGDPTWLFNQRSTARSRAIRTRRHRAASSNLSSTVRSRWCPQWIDGFQSCKILLIVGYHYAFICLSDGRDDHVERASWTALCGSVCHQSRPD
jgi:hypothetical protein